mgnify:FL=1
MTGPDLALSVRALVGVPFRLHGRDPATGLDCIGVLEAALRGCGVPVRLPCDYTLRTRRLPPLGDWTGRLGFLRGEGPVQPGDVAMLRPAACLHHLAIATAPDRFVHAHAGLRRVVEGPLPRDWAEIRRWRPTSSET